MISDNGTLDMLSHLILEELRRRPRLRLLLLLQSALAFEIRGLLSDGACMVLPENPIPLN